MANRFNKINSLKYPIHVVPAHRKITAEDKEWELHGTGVIKKLNQIKEHLIGQENQREKFNLINSFVCEILGNPAAKLEIPYGDTATPAEWGQYNDVTTYSKNNKEHAIDKVKVARILVAQSTDFLQLDLEQKVNELVSFIRQANGY
ncbi:hypothetical protein [Sporomusa paucivorans]|uniref:hypothetical protein n=1 Tax=Sporomusa paucivorans TaxID=2376 RepID=UPI003570D9B0